jgi:hypothetical protein
LLTEAEARLYLALIGLLPSGNVGKRRRRRLDFYCDGSLEGLLNCELL